MARHIVNHAGIVHSVNDEQFELHLGAASIKPNEHNPSGKFAREATEDEISAWYAHQGLVWNAATGEALPASEAKPEAKPASGRGR